MKIRDHVVEVQEPSSGPLGEPRLFRQVIHVYSSSHKQIRGIDPNLLPHSVI